MKGPMKPLFSGVFFILSFLAPRSLQAQTQTWSWQQIADKALQQNASLQAAKAQVSAAESSEASARWKFGPTLSAQGKWSEQSVANSNPVQDTSVTLGISQNVLNYSNFGSLESAQAQHRGKTATLSKTQAQLLRDLKVAFSTVQETQQALTLQKSILQRRQKNYEMVTLRYEGGKEDKGALLLSKANLEDTHATVLNNEADHTSAVAQLNLLLGNPAQDPLQVTGSPPLTPPESAVDFESLMKSSPERQESLASEEASAAAVKTAKGKLLPTLDVTAQVGKYGDRLWPQTNGWSTGVTLNIPLGDGSSYHQKQAASAESLAASFTRQSVENDLRLRLQKAHASYQESERQEKMAQSFLQAAQLRAEVARRKYETGLLSFDEWDRIESDLITRETTALRASLSRITAIADWEYLAGTGAAK